MDIHRKCLGSPASHLLDGKRGYAIEVHGHGASSAQGMTADVAGGVAVAVEADVFGGCLEGGVDLLGCDHAPGRKERVLEMEDWEGGRPAVGKDVVDSPGQ